MRHIVDFRNTSDTGEIDADAIIPYSDGEAANQTTFRRPVENTRSRTEVLRSLMREHILMRDMDRNGPGMWGGGTITFNGTVAGGGDGKFSISSSLYIVPMITPGDGVGTTPPYVASSKARLTIGTLGSNQVIVESVRKQFEGAGGLADLAKADVNKLSIEVLNDTAESIVLEGASGDVNNIKVKIISGTTTAQDLIDLINNDITVTQYVTASLEGTSTGTNNADLFGPTEWGSDFSLRFLKGGYPGIVHEIPFGNVSSFFAAHAENPLKKGDTLAISYDEIIDKTNLGGVLQSTTENGNTVMSAGSLFNTRREPHKCANAIAVCKCIDDNTILFSDGSYITKGVPATLYFDSGSVTNAALLGAIDTTGWTRMHQAPGAHVPPTNVQQALNNADDLLQTTMAEVETARNSTVYGAQSSLDARLEAADVEVSNARNSSVYGAQASLDLRIEQSDGEINTARTSSVFGAKASLDARIEAVDTHASTILTVGPTGSGRMYTGTTGLYDALQAIKAVGGIILVDYASSSYTMSDNVVCTRCVQIIGKKLFGQARLNLGSYKLTFDGGGYANNSGITNMYLDGGMSGVQLEFGDPWCFMRECYFTCEIALTSDARHFNMDSCDNWVPTRTSVTVNYGADYATFFRCRWYHSHDGDYSIVFSNASYTTFDTCEFTIAGGNGLKTFGDHTVYRNIQIDADMDAAGTTAVIGVYTDGVLENVYIRHKGFTDIVQRAVTIQEGVGRNVNVDCGGYEIRTPSSTFFGVYTTNIDHPASLDGFSLTNFKLPFDTNTLSVAEPVIGVYSTAGGICTLRHGFVGDMGHNSASGNMNCTLIGNSTGTGAIVIDDVTIDTSGISYATGTRYVIARLPTGSTVRNCRIMGTGLWHTGIYADPANNLSIHDNVFFLTGAWVHAINLWDNNYGGVERNKVVFNGAMTGNIIQVASAGGGNHTNVSHNSIENTGAPWTTAEGIYLSNQAADLVFGNIVPVDVGSSHITYVGSAVNMIPLSANISTYNQIS